MAATRWKKLYGPIVTPNGAANIILTVPANVSAVITKFTVSNTTVTAAIAAITITPAAGAAVLTVRVVVPGYPTLGGCVEITQLEGQILEAGDTITFQDITGAVLVPFISGTIYTA